MATLALRDGTHADQPAIAAMTRDIWEGDDYLAAVWHEWVNAPNSRLRVGELAGELVAAGRIVELSPGYWWLEGLRVHPQQQGKGLARQFHDALLALAREQPTLRVLALATSWENGAVAHMAEQSGMAMQGKYRLWKAQPTTAPEPAVQPLRPAEWPAAVEALLHGAWAGAGGGFVADGWVVRPLDATWLHERLAQGLGWRCGEALALAGGGAREGRAWLYALAGGTVAERAALVRHARWRAAALDSDALRCFVPEAPPQGAPLDEPLRAAGMGDPWGGDEGPFYLLHFAWQRPTAATP